MVTLGMEPQTIPSHCRNSITDVDDYCGASRNVTSVLSKLLLTLVCSLLSLGQHLGISAKQLALALADSGGGEQALTIFDNLRHWTEVSRVAISMVNMFIGDMIIVGVQNYLVVVVLLHIMLPSDLPCLASLQSQLVDYWGAAAHHTWHNR